MKKILVIALIVSIVGLGVLRANAQSYPIALQFNGTSLETSWTPATSPTGCTAVWTPFFGLLDPTGYYSLCPGFSGLPDQVVLSWTNLNRPFYLSNIVVYGQASGTHQLIVSVDSPSGIYVYQSAFVPSSNNYDVIQIDEYVNSLTLIKSIGTLDSFPARTIIQQIDLNGSNSAPVTNTPRPTSTALPSITPLPTLTQANTSVPLVTRVSGPNTPYPSLDACANLSQPCGTLAVFPTIALPTLNLPSPTPYQVRSTPTPRPITATPAPSNTATITPSPTQQIAASITPNATPISMLLTPTSAFVDPLNSLSGAVGSYQATSEAIMNGGVTINGTPQGVVGLAAQLGGGVAQPIRLARMLEMTDLNKVGGFISFLLLLIAGEVFISIASVVIPVLNRLIGWAISLGQLLAQVISGFFSVVKGFIK
jgi:hypothetical protein